MSYIPKKSIRTALRDNPRSLIGTRWRYNTLGRYHQPSYDVIQCVELVYRQVSVVTVFSDNPISFHLPVQNFFDSVSPLAYIGKASDHHWLRAGRVISRTDNREVYKFCNLRHASLCLVSELTLSRPNNGDFLPGGHTGYSFFDYSYHMMKGFKPVGENTSYELLRIWDQQRLEAMRPKAPPPPPPPAPTVEGAERFERPELL